MVLVHKVVKELALLCNVRISKGFERADFASAAADVDGARVRPCCDGFHQSFCDLSEPGAFVFHGCMVVPGFSARAEEDVPNLQFKVELRTVHQVCSGNSLRELRECGCRG